MTHICELASVIVGHIFSCLLLI